MSLQKYLGAQCKKKKTNVNVLDEFLGYRKVGQGT